MLLMLWITIQIFLKIEVGQRGCDPQVENHCVSVKKKVPDNDNMITGVLISKICEYNCMSMVQK